MSESETFEVQGRAHAQAKKLRSEIASTTVALREVRKWLGTLDTRIDHAHQIGNPVERQRGIATIIGELRNQRADSLERVARLLEELQANGIELAELEHEIGKF
jgi:hypothetical protein